MNIRTVILCVILKVVQIHGLLQLRTSLASSDNPLLTKILQSIDAATSDEHLIEVTVKLLKSLCVCMRDTLKAKEDRYNSDKNLFGLSKSINTEGKVLDLYKKIYNKTCFNLKEDFSKRKNRSGESWNHSNCGRDKSSKTVEEDNIRNVKKVLRYKLEHILYRALVQTRHHHKYKIKKYNLFGKAKSRIKGSPKHTLIVILTLHPARKDLRKYNVIEEDLHKILHKNSTIEIDIIDTRYDQKENESEETQKPEIYSDCHLQSLYTYLTESEKKNLTKVFRFLRRRDTIKIYIEVFTGRNHSDYINICCENGTITSSCKKGLIKSLTSEEATVSNKTLDNEKSKALHTNFKNTISKLKTLVAKLNKKSVSNTSSSLGINDTYVTNKIGIKTENMKYVLSSLKERSAIIDPELGFKANSIPNLVGNLTHPIKLQDVSRAIILLNDFMSKQTTTNSPHRNQTYTVENTEAPIEKVVNTLYLQALVVNATKNVFHKFQDSINKKKETAQYGNIFSENITVQYNDLTKLTKSYKTATSLKATKDTVHNSPSLNFTLTDVDSETLTHDLITHVTNVSHANKLKKQPDHLPRNSMSSSEKNIYNMNYQKTNSLKYFSTMSSIIQQQNLYKNIDLSTKQQDEDMYTTNNDSETVTNVPNWKDIELTGAQTIKTKASSFSTSMSENIYDLVLSNRSHPIKADNMTLFEPNTTIFPSNCSKLFQRHVKIELKKALPNSVFQMHTNKLINKTRTHNSTVKTTAGVLTDDDQRLRDDGDSVQERKIDKYDVDSTLIVTNDKKQHTYPDMSSNTSMSSNLTPSTASGNEQNSISNESLETSTTIGVSIKATELFPNEIISLTPYKKIRVITEQESLLKNITNSFTTKRSTKLGTNLLIPYITTYEKQYLNILNNTLNLTPHEENIKNSVRITPSSNIEQLNKQLNIADNLHEEFTQVSTALTPRLTDAKYYEINQESLMPITKILNNRIDAMTNKIVADIDNHYDYNISETTIADTLTTTENIDTLLSELLTESNTDSFKHNMSVNEIQDTITNSTMRHRNSISSPTNFVKNTHPMTDFTITNENKKHNVITNPNILPSNITKLLTFSNKYTPTMKNRRPNISNITLDYYMSEKDIQEVITKPIILQRNSTISLKNSVKIPPLVSKKNSIISTSTIRNDTKFFNSPTENNTHSKTSIMIDYNEQDVITNLNISKNITNSLPYLDKPTPSSKYTNPTISTNIEKYSSILDNVLTENKESITDPLSYIMSENEIQDIITYPSILYRNSTTSSTNSMKDTSSIIDASLTISTTTQMNYPMLTSVIEKYKSDIYLTRNVSEYEIPDVLTNAVILPKIRTKSRTDSTEAIFKKQRTKNIKFDILSHTRSENVKQILSTNPFVLFRHRTESSTENNLILLTDLVTEINKSDVGSMNQLGENKVQIPITNPAVQTRNSSTDSVNYRPSMINTGLNIATTKEKFNKMSTDEERLIYSMSQPEPVRETIPIKLQKPSIFDKTKYIFNNTLKSINNVNQRLYLSNKNYSSHENKGTANLLSRNFVQSTNSKPKVYNNDVTENVYYIENYTSENTNYLKNPSTISTNDKNLSRVQYTITNVTAPSTKFTLFQQLHEFKKTESPTTYTLLPKKLNTLNHVQDIVTNNPNDITSEEIILYTNNPVFEELHQYDNTANYVFNSTPVLRDKLNVTKKDKITNYDSRNITNTKNIRKITNIPFSSQKAFNDVMLKTIKYAVQKETNSDISYDFNYTENVPSIKNEDKSLSTRNINNDEGKINSYFVRPYFYNKNSKELSNRISKYTLPIVQINTSAVLYNVENSEKNILTATFKLKNDVKPLKDRNTPIIINLNNVKNNITQTSENSLTRMLPNQKITKHLNSYDLADGVKLSSDPDSTTDLGSTKIFLTGSMPAVYNTNSIDNIRNISHLHINVTSKPTNNEKIILNLNNINNNYNNNKIHSNLNLHTLQRIVSNPTSERFVKYSVPNTKRIKPENEVNAVDVKRTVPDSFTITKNTPHVNSKKFNMTSHNGIFNTILPTLVFSDNEMINIVKYNTWTSYLVPKSTPRTATQSMLTEKIQSTAFYNNSTLTEREDISKGTFTNSTNILSLNIHKDFTTLNKSFSEYLPNTNTKKILSYPPVKLNLKTNLKPTGLENIPIITFKTIKPVSTVLLATDESTKHKQTLSPYLSYERSSHGSVNPISMNPTLPSYDTLYTKYNNRTFYTSNADEIKTKFPNYVTLSGQKLYTLSEITDNLKNSVTKTLPVKNTQTIGQYFDHSNSMKTLETTSKLLQTTEKIKLSLWKPQVEIKNNKIMNLATHFAPSASNKNSIKLQALPQKVKLNYELQNDLEFALNILNSTFTYRTLKNDLNNITEGLHLFGNRTIEKTKSPRKETVTYEATTRSLFNQKTTNVKKYEVTTDVLSSDKYLYSNIPNMIHNQNISKHINKETIKLLPRLNEIAFSSKYKNKHTILVPTPHQTRNNTLKMTEPSAFQLSIHVGIEKTKDQIQFSLISIDQNPDNISQLLKPKLVKKALMSSTLPININRVKLVTSSTDNLGKRLENNILSHKNLTRRANQINNIPGIIVKNKDFENMSSRKTTIRINQKKNNVTNFSKDDIFPTNYEESSQFPNEGGTAHTTNTSEYAHVSSTAQPTKRKHKKIIIKPASLTEQFSMETLKRMYKEQFQKVKFNDSIGRPNVSQRNVFKNKPLLSKNPDSKMQHNVSSIDFSSVSQDDDTSTFVGYDNQKNQMKYANNSENHQYNYNENKILNTTHNSAKKISIQNNTKLNYSYNEQSIHNFTTNENDPYNRSEDNKMLSTTTINNQIMLSFFFSDTTSNNNVSTVEPYDTLTNEYNTNATNIIYDHYNDKNAVLLEICKENKCIESQHELLKSNISSKYGSGTNNSIITENILIKLTSEYSRDTNNSITAENRMASSPIQHNKEGDKTKETISGKYTKLMGVTKQPKKKRKKYKGLERKKLVDALKYKTNITSILRKLVKAKKLDLKKLNVTNKKQALNYLLSKIRKPTIHINVTHSQNKFSTISTTAIFQNNMTESYKTQIDKPTRKSFVDHEHSPEKSPLQDILLKPILVISDKTNSIEMSTSTSSFNSGHISVISTIKSTQSVDQDIILKETLNLAKHFQHLKKNIFHRISESTFDQIGIRDKITKLISLKPKYSKNNLAKFMNSVTFNSTPILKKKTDNGTEFTKNIIDANKKLNSNSDILSTAKTKPQNDKHYITININIPNSFLHDLTKETAHKPNKSQKQRIPNTIFQKNNSVLIKERSLSTSTSFLLSNITNDIHSALAKSLGGLTPSPLKETYSASDISDTSRNKRTSSNNLGRYVTLNHPQLNSNSIHSAITKSLGGLTPSPLKETYSASDIFDTSRNKRTSSNNLGRYATLNHPQLNSNSIHSAITKSLGGLTPSPLKETNSAFDNFDTSQNKQTSFNNLGRHVTINHPQLNSNSIQAAIAKSLGGLTPSPLKETNSAFDNFDTSQNKRTSFNNLGRYVSINHPQLNSRSIQSAITKSLGGLTPSPLKETNSAFDNFDTSQNKRTSSNNLGRYVSINHPQLNSRSIQSAITKSLGGLTPSPLKETNSASDIFDTSQNKRTSSYNLGRYDTINHPQLNSNSIHSAITKSLGGLTPSPLIENNSASDILDTSQNKRTSSYSLRRYVTVNHPQLNSNSIHYTITKSLGGLTPSPLKETNSASDIVDTSQNKRTSYNLRRYVTINHPLLNSNSIHSAITKSIGGLTPSPLKETNSASDNFDTSQNKQTSYNLRRYVTINHPLLNSNSIHSAITKSFGGLTPSPLKETNGAPDSFDISQNKRTSYNLRRYVTINHPLLNINPNLHTDVLEPYTVEITTRIPAISSPSKEGNINSFLRTSSNVNNYKNSITSYGNNNSEWLLTTVTLPQYIELSPITNELHIIDNNVTEHKLKNNIHATTKNKYLYITGTKFTRNPKLFHNIFDHNHSSHYKETSKSLSPNINKLPSIPSSTAISNFKVHDQSTNKFVYNNISHVNSSQGLFDVSTPNNNVKIKDATNSSIISSKYIILQIGQITTPPKSAIKETRNEIVSNITENVEMENIIGNITLSYDSLLKKEYQFKNTKYNDLREKNMSNFVPGISQSSNYSILKGMKTTHIGPLTSVRIESTTYQPYDIVNSVMYTNKQNLLLNENQISPFTVTGINKHVTHRHKSHTVNKFKQSPKKSIERTTHTNFSEKQQALFTNTSQSYNITDNEITTSARTEILKKQYKKRSKYDFFETSTQKVLVLLKKSTSQAVSKIAVDEITTQRNSNFNCTTYSNTKVFSSLPTVKNSLEIDSRDKIRRTLIKNVNELFSLTHNRQDNKTSNIIYKTNVVNPKNVTELNNHTSHMRWSVSSVTNSPVTSQLHLFDSQSNNTIWDPHSRRGLINNILSFSISDVNKMPLNNHYATKSSIMTSQSKLNLKLESSNRIEEKSPVAMLNPILELQISTDMIYPETNMTLKDIVMLKNKSTTFYTTPSIKDFHILRNVQYKLNPNVTIMNSLANQNWNYTAPSAQTPTQQYPNNTSTKKWIETNESTTPIIDQKNNQILPTPTANNTLEYILTNFTTFIDSKSIQEKVVNILGPRLNRLHFLKYPTHITTKNIKYNTYQPLIKDDFESSNPTPKLSQSPKIPCAVLKTMRHKFKSTFGFTQFLKASNCTFNNNLTIHLNVKNDRFTHLPIKPKEINKMKNSHHFKNEHTNMRLSKKVYTKLRSSESLMHTLEKTNLLPVNGVKKHHLKLPPGVLKRINIGRRKEIMTMNTHAFFSQHRLQHPGNLNDYIRQPPKNQYFRTPFTSKPRHSVLRPKFDTLQSSWPINKPRKFFLSPKNIQEVDPEVHKLISYDKMSNWKQKIGAVHAALQNNPLDSIQRQMKMIVNNVMDRPLTHTKTGYDRNILKEKIELGNRKMWGPPDFAKAVTPSNININLPQPVTPFRHNPLQLQYRRNHPAVTHTTKLITVKPPRTSRRRRTIFFLSPTVSYSFEHYDDF